MTAIKRIFETSGEKREIQHLNRRIMLAFSNKRDVWNGKRRFGY